MKRILITIISLCLLLSLTLQAFAEEIKVAEDGREYAAGSILISTKFLVDESYYDGAEAKDFHGVSVIRFRALLRYDCDTPAEAFEKFGSVLYVADLDPSVDEQEAVAILNAVDGIGGAMLDYLAEPDIPKPITVGDVNCNGKLDARDYLLLKRAYFGTYELECDDAVADINGNGKLDARDYLLIKRAYFGTYTLGTPEATPDEA